MASIREEDEWDFREYPDQRNAYRFVCATPAETKKEKKKTMAKKDRMKSEDVKIHTPEFRVSYPNVFEAVKVNPTDAKAKFGVVAIFQIEDTEKSKAAGTKALGVGGLEKLKQLCRDVATEKFGADRTKWPPLKFPFRDGGTEPSHKDKDGYGPGTIFVSLQSVQMPGIVESFAGPDGRPAPLGAKTDFYAGCYARAEVNAYYWKFMGKEGVSLGLQNLQKLRDGERFGGRGNAAASFDAIEAPKGAAVPAGAGAASNAADPTGV